MEGRGRHRVDAPSGGIFMPAAGESMIRALSTTATAADQ
jgi:hypothetical protein